MTFGQNVLSTNDQITQTQDVRIYDLTETSLVIRDVVWLVASKMTSSGTGGAIISIIHEPEGDGGHSLAKLLFSFKFSETIISYLSFLGFFDICCDVSDTSVRWVFIFTLPPS